MVFLGFHSSGVLEQSRWDDNGGQGDATHKDEHFKANTVTAGGMEVEVGCYQETRWLEFAGKYILDHGSFAPLHRSYQLEKPQRNFLPKHRLIGACGQEVDYMHHQRIMSSEIAKAVELASAEGNEILSVSEGWAEVRQVVHMKRPLTDALRNRILLLTLRHWTTEPTPHNKAEVGFSDDTDRVALAFPA